MKETAVTIRERALQELVAGGPQGLTMDGLASAVSGPWQESAVRAVLRKLWDAGELTRREDGTFVQSGQRAHDSHHQRLHFHPYPPVHKATGYLSQRMVPKRTGAPTNSASRLRVHRT